MQTDHHVKLLPTRAVRRGAVQLAAQGLALLRRLAGSGSNYTSSVRGYCYDRGGRRRCVYAHIALKSSSPFASLAGA